MREKILLAGETNTSKTVSLIHLALIYPENRIVILDPDDGIAKGVAEIGINLPNLTVVPITQDFQQVLDVYYAWKGVLVEKDWLCFDMLGRFWDFAQQYYSLQVFGEDQADHIMKLKTQTGRADFGGFDGLTDWNYIKKIHNTKLMDNATLYTPFNIMATTSVTMFSPKERVNKTGVMGMYAAEFGVKPEGEKHNIYRFDTQAVLYRKIDGTYNFRLMRDRGRAIDTKKEFDITNKSFMQVYKEFRGI